MLKNRVSIEKKAIVPTKFTGALVKPGDIFRHKDGEQIYMALDVFYSDDWNNKKGRRKIVALSTGSVYPLNPQAELQRICDNEVVTIERN